MGCASSGPSAVLRLDFDSRPGTESKSVDIHRRLASAIDQCEELASMLSKYQGVGKEVLQPASDPESKRAAFQVLVSKASTVRDLSTFCKQVGDVLRPALEMVATAEAAEVHEIDTIRLIAELFAGLMQIDFVKLRTPALQNDFSFYRRAATQRRDDVPPIPESDAAEYGVFLSNASPMLTAASLAVRSRADTNPSILGIVASIANSCALLASRGALKSPEAWHKCTRCMVAAILVYDQVVPAGAFCAQSNIDVVKCVRALDNHPVPPDKTALRNSIKFASRTFRQPTTTDAIRRVLP